MENTADTWAVRAALPRGLFPTYTLPWWRTTSWVWLTSKSLLINQHWKISWFHTPVSQNLGHCYTPAQPNHNIRWVKWPANDSPLNTNSFWNWNTGILLIKIIIYQWSALIKGLNGGQWGEQSRTPAALQPAPALAALLRQVFLRETATRGESTRCHPISEQATTADPRQHFHRL